LFYVAYLLRSLALSLHLLSYQVFSFTSMCSFKKIIANNVNIPKYFHVYPSRILPTGLSLYAYMKSVE